MSSPCKIQRTKLNMRVWRNWQTRKIQVLVEATLYRFKSCYPHQNRKIRTLFPIGKGFGFFVYFWNITYNYSSAIKRLQSFFNHVMLMLISPWIACFIFTQRVLAINEKELSLVVNVLGQLPYTVCKSSIIIWPTSPFTVTLTTKNPGP